MLWQSVPRREMGQRGHLISFIVKEKSKQTNKQNIRSRNQILVSFLLTVTEALLEILCTVWSLLQLTQSKAIPTRETATKTMQISLLAQNNACFQLFHFLQEYRWCWFLPSFPPFIPVSSLRSFLPFLPLSLSLPSLKWNYS